MRTPPPTPPLPHLPRSPVQPQPRGRRGDGAAVAADRAGAVLPVAVTGSPLPLPECGGGGGGCCWDLELTAVFPPHRPLLYTQEYSEQPSPPLSALETVPGLTCVGCAHGFSTGESSSLAEQQFFHRFEPSHGGGVSVLLSMWSGEKKTFPEKRMFLGIGPNLTPVQKSFARALFRWVVRELCKPLGLPLHPPPPIKEKEPDEGGGREKKEKEKKGGERARSRDGPHPGHHPSQETLRGCTGWKDGGSGEGDWAGGAGPRQ